MTAIKNIIIQASTTYPVISAWEYEHLKLEKVVLKRMKRCTIYVIMQRPLTYFNNVIPDDDGLRFDIIDGTGPPLNCYLPFAKNGFCEPTGTTDIEFGFHKKMPDKAAPFNDVAAIKLRRANGSFIVWFSPQKFIYEVLCGNVTAEIDGNPLQFSDYHVHYIGQAFDQEIWKRLTGHSKFQSVLIRERPMGDPSTHAPMEVSIAMLSIVGFDEVLLVGSYEAFVPAGVTAIQHSLITSKDSDRYSKTWLKPNAPELTNEVEAMLINQFKPNYNDIKFKIYPNIKSGTRSKGYTTASLVIEKLPLILSTPNHRIEPAI